MPLSSDIPSVWYRDRSATDALLSQTRPDETIVVTDFDKTLTVDTGYTSWSLFSRSGLMPEEYVTERNALHAQYYPSEIDPTLDPLVKNATMRTWWLGHLELFIRYRLRRDILSTIVANTVYMRYREGIPGFLAHLREMRIPTVIVSAGVGDTIELFLRETGEWSDHIDIFSNRLKWDEDDACIGIHSEEIVHPCNKNTFMEGGTHARLFEGKKLVILLGDSIEDVKMYPPHDGVDILRIGFVNDPATPHLESYQRAFDILVLSPTETHGVLTEVVDRLKKTR